MKNTKKLFPIALVLVVLISASSMALACTPTNGSATPAASAATPTTSTGTPTDGSATPTSGSGIPIELAGLPIEFANIPSILAGTPTGGSGTYIGGSGIPTGGSGIPTDGSGTPTTLAGIPTDGSAGAFTAPDAAFDAKQTTGKAPFNVSFIDKSTGTIFMWNWNFGDETQTSNEQNPIHSYAAAGKYNVTLEVMGMGSDTITKVISVVVSKPAVAAVAAKTPVAAFSTSISKRTVKFADKSTNNPTSWSWDFGDKSCSTSKNPSHTYKKAGKFKVILTAKNAKGSNQKTSYVTVK
jgi:PKD repeat protein